MAVTGRAGVAPPNAYTLLTPLLPALAAAAVSTEPAAAVLPLLSPILRQRVQFLSASSTEPWLRLLCYDSAKAAKLAEAASSGCLEPHPVSGEVEVDWDYDSETRYRRLDAETLQALVVLQEKALAFQLVYCIGDREGGGDGWRVGEVTVPEKSSPFSLFGGAPTLAEAEQMFKEVSETKQSGLANGQATNGVTASRLAVPAEDDDDDDDYWARYDATPSRTPAEKRSPAPPPANDKPTSAYEIASAEDQYYAQYDSVQPAMDNHDPDEVVPESDISPPLGFGGSRGAATVNDANIPDVASDVEEHNYDGGSIAVTRHAELLHPRPESSASSKGSETVARLEEEAGRQGQNEFGVKQHIARSIRSLFMLSRASGIQREEFESLVKTELDVLGMMDDHE